MKRPLAAVVSVILLLVGATYGEVPIDVSGSRCEGKSTDTVRIRNIVVPGLPGTVWADFLWDRDALILQPAAAGQESASVLSAQTKADIERVRQDAPMTLDAMALLKMTGEAKNRFLNDKLIDLASKYYLSTPEVKVKIVRDMLYWIDKAWTIALADERMNMTEIEAWLAPYLEDLYLLYQQ